MAEHPGRLKELVRGFSTRLSTKIPGIKQQPFRKVDLPRVQIISSIKATQAVVQKIARIEGISEDAAAKRLRSIGSEIGGQDTADYSGVGRPPSHRRPEDPPANDLSRNRQAGRPTADEGARRDDPGGVPSEDKPPHARPRSTEVTP